MEKGCLADQGTLYLTAEIHVVKFCQEKNVSIDDIHIHHFMKTNLKIVAVNKLWEKDGSCLMKEVQLEIICMKK